jgi:hypothetical protein
LCWCRQKSSVQSQVYIDGEEIRNVLSGAVLIGASGAYAGAYGEPEQRAAALTRHSRPDPWEPTQLLLRKAVIGRQHVIKRRRRGRMSPRAEAQSTLDVRDHPCLITGSKLSHQPPLSRGFLLFSQILHLSDHIGLVLLSMSDALESKSSLVISIFPFFH